MFTLINPTTLVKSMTTRSWLVFITWLGGKRTLKLPPELAYGVRGAGCRGGKLSSHILFPLFVEPDEVQDSLIWLLTNLLLYMPWCRLMHYSSRFSSSVWCGIHWQGMRSGPRASQQQCLLWIVCLVVKWRDDNMCMFGCLWKCQHIVMRRRNISAYEHITLLAMELSFLWVIDQSSNQTISNFNLWVY